MRPFSRRMYPVTITVFARLDADSDAEGGEEPDYAPGVVHQAAMQLVSPTRLMSRLQGREMGSIVTETDWVIKTPNDLSSKADDKADWDGRVLMLLGPSKPTSFQADGTPVNYATEAVQRV